MNRRDMILGGTLLVAAGGAEYLRPRNRLLLLPEGRDLEDVVPKRIGNWVPMASEGLVLPKVPGSLAAQLYNQTVNRLYVSDRKTPVMLVIAYGAEQSDLLQLHRPEVCYTAVGFSISSSEATTVSLNPVAKLPARELTARSETRVEPILYWTRIGDDLPTSGREQRWVKLRQQMNGYLADGVLVRLSTIGEPSPAAFADLAEFAREMILAIAPKDRPALIGRPLASQLK
jgi:EpsI family protein